MIIEDGSGTGRTAKIDGENRLHTESLSTTVERHANQVEGSAYNVLFAVTPAGADDMLFYLKNNSETDLVVEGIWWQAASAEQVYYNVGDTGTPGGASKADITPANLNAGSGKNADVTCISRTADAAVDIEGVSGGVTIQKLWLTSAATTIFNCEQDIVIPKNQTFTIYAVAGSIALRGTVAFHFHNAN